MSSSRLGAHANERKAHFLWLPTDILVHSLFMFVIQLWLTFQNFVILSDEFGIAEQYDDRTPRWVPKWLILWSQGWLAGNADCVQDPREARPKRGKEYCGVFYMILTGYLPVSESQVLKGIMEHVFALVGTPFLLFIRYVVDVQRKYFMVSGIPEALKKAGTFCGQNSEFFVPC